MGVLFARVGRIASVGLFCLIALGCGGVSKIDAERVSSLWDVLGPRHREYVAKDPSLANDPESRAKRLETVDRMDQAVRDLKGSSR